MASHLRVTVLTVEKTRVDYESVALSVTSHGMVVGTITSCQLRCNARTRTQSAGGVPNTRNASDHRAEPACRWKDA